MKQRIFSTDNSYSWLLLRVTLGLVMGAHGVQKAFGWVGGRYQIGLNNINDIDNKDEWKNQGFQLYVGAKIL